MKRHEFGTLDAVRGVAAIVVVIWHVGLKLGVAIGSGYLAVDLFFMLSGFVIAHSYEGMLRQGWSPIGFGVTRIVRLWPLYLLATASALAVAAGTAPVNGDLLRSAASAPLLLPRWHAAAGVAFPLDDPAWSLCCEVVANIGYGLIGFRLSTGTLTAFALLCLVGMAATAHSHADLHVALNLGALTRHLHVGLLRTGFAFSIGVVLYRYWQAGRLPPMPLPPFVPVLLAVLALIVPSATENHALAVALAIVALGFPVIIVAAAQAELRGGWRWLARTSARLSYPLYLIHMVVLGAAAAALARFGGQPTIVMAAAGVLALLISDPLDRLYDRPARRWLNRRFDMRPRITGGAPPP